MCGWGEGEGIYLLPLFVQLVHKPQQFLLVVLPWVIDVGLCLKDTSGLSLGILENPTKN